MNKPWDAIIVGAGPAGSTAGAFLAEAGHRVLVLEREEFPRFHIGESLLPLGTSVLERLRVPAPKDVFHFKRGAQFVCEKTHRTADFSFAESYPGFPRHAWQVERAYFDTLLRDRAVEAGATVRHGEFVKDIAIESDGVRVHTETESIRGRYLVDATGLNKMMARRAKAIKPYKDFGAAAAFQHFDDVSGDITAEHGDIRIFMTPGGWGWAIPLPNRRLSVGIVMQKDAQASLVESFVEGSPLLREWTQGSTASEPTLIGNYAFKNEASTGERFVSIGDAACFLDPVFSSGVSLALTGADHATRILIPALAEGREADPELMTPFKTHMEKAYSSFGALISRFYNTKLVSNVFLDATPESDMRQGIISVLGGDVWRDDNPFQEMLTRSRRVAINE